eukprot:scaffold5023_cov55-Phaeocystis_antarctica.AAC.3
MRLPRQPQPCGHTPPEESRANGQLSSRVPGAVAGLPKRCQTPSSQLRISLNNPPSLSPDLRLSTRWGGPTPMTQNSSYLNPMPRQHQTAVTHPHHMRCHAGVIRDRARRKRIRENTGKRRKT